MVGFLKVQKNECVFFYYFMFVFICYYGFNILLYDFGVDSEEEFFNKLKYVVKVVQLRIISFKILIDGNLVL